MSDSKESERCTARSGGGSLCQQPAGHSGPHSAYKGGLRWTTDWQAFSRGPRVPSADPSSRNEVSS